LEAEWALGGRPWLARLNGNGAADEVPIASVGPIGLVGLVGRWVCVGQLLVRGSGRRYVRELRDIRRERSWFESSRVRVTVVVREEKRKEEKKGERDQPLQQHEA
jgi:hypothetical protein